MTGPALLRLAAWIGAACAFALILFVFLPMVSIQ